MGYPQVSIIVINWNGWEDTIECLESIFGIDYPHYNVIIVDNHSKDDSLSKIREYCNGKLKPDSDFFKYNDHNKPIEFSEFYINELSPPKSIKKLAIIKNHENQGFAGGNNIGLKFGLENTNSEYFLLLNNDTVVDKQFLKHLVNHAGSEVAIMGPKIYFYDKPDTIWSAGCRISWNFSRGIQIGSGEVDTGQYNNLTEVEYVSGAAFLIRRDVINRIGLMDEKYFLYFEESDWALMAHQAGFKCYYIPQAKVWHKVSATGGGISKPLGLYYITRNRWIFMRRWAKKSNYSFFVIYQIIGAIILPLALSIYFQNWKLFSAYYKGLKDGVLF
jgi:GT2 family glycosyltransferase